MSQGFRVVAVEANRKAIEAGSIRWGNLWLYSSGIFHGFAMKHTNLKHEMGHVPYGLWKTEEMNMAHVVP